MLLTSLVLAAGLSGQPDPAGAVDADHQFLRTYWAEIYRLNPQQSPDKRKTREIHPQRATGASLPIEHPHQIRIPDLF